MTAISKKHIKLFFLNVVQETPRRVSVKYDHREERFEGRGCMSRRLDKP